MKVKAVATLSLFLLFLSVSSVIADSDWEIRDNMISTTTTGSSQIEGRLYFGVSSASGSTYLNVSLPTNISELCNTSTHLRLAVGIGNLSYNFTVNGVSNATLWNKTTSTTVDVTLANMTARGVSTTDEYLNVSVVNWGANDSGALSLNITTNGTYATLLTTFVSSQLGSVREDIKTTPKIKTSRSSSYISVVDRALFRNNIATTALGATSGFINLTSLNIRVTYPSNAINDGGNLTYSKITSTNTTSGTRYGEVGYQKRGPWVKDVDSTENTNEVEIEVRSYADFTDEVEWTIDFTDEEYEDYFSNVNINTLTITCDGDNIPFTNGSIVMDDIDLEEGENIFTFNWTTAVSTTVPTVPWYNQNVLGLPIWGILIITVVAILAIVVMAMVIRK